MPRTVRTFQPAALALLLFGAAIVFDAQDSNATPRLSTGAWQATQSSLVETGQLLVAGHEVPYRIRNLPVSSFPDLPPGVAETLNDRGCLIPQTYEAKGPENVIHGSFEHSGSNDWAVLCSAKGQVELLVFFSSAFSSMTQRASSVSTGASIRQLPNAFTKLRPACPTARNLQITTVLRKPPWNTTPRIIFTGTVPGDRSRLNSHRRNPKELESCPKP